MKIFFGTIFTLIFIGLACFAGYFAYDLYFNDHTQSDSQSSKDVQQSQEESYQNNDANTQSRKESGSQSNETPSQQTDEKTTPVTDEPSENNDSIKQTSPNKPSAQQSVYLTDAEKNEREQLEQKKLDAMAGKTTMSATESERFRNLTARFEASKTLDENQ